MFLLFLFFFFKSTVSGARARAGSTGLPCYYYYSYSNNYCRYYMFKLPKHPPFLNHDIGVGQLAIAEVRRDGASHKKRRRHGLVFSC